MVNLRISCVPVCEFFCGYLSFSLSFSAGLLVSAATNDASLSISFSTGDTKLDSNTPCDLNEVLYSWPYLVSRMFMARFIINSL